MAYLSISYLEVTDMPFLNFGDLRRKEVINMRDGARLGCICDLEVDQ